MREYLSFPPGPAAWPELPGKGRSWAGDGSSDLTAAVTDVISVTGDTKRLVHLCTGLLAAVLAGSAAVASALLGRGQVVALGSVGLLLPVLLSWLVAVALVLLAERPVTGAFAEVRRSTGAPVDPSAPWRPLGVQPLADAAVTWDHVVPLIAAATRQHARARLALSAAVITTAAFLCWMMLSLTAATMT